MPAPEGVVETNKIMIIWYVNIQCDVMRINVNFVNKGEKSALTLKLMYQLIVGKVTRQKRNW